jgi:hypothetical protein
MKTCTNPSCPYTNPQPYDNFYKSTSKSAKDGYEFKCKECEKARRRNKYKRFKKRELAYQRMYKRLYPEQIKEWSRKWREKNIEWDRESKRLYMRENKEKVKKWNKDYQKRLKRDLSKFEYNALLVHRLWLSRYKKKKILPKWLTKAQKQEIYSIYLKAAYLTYTTGIKYCVDHIIPVHGKEITGLHVPWNLQILTISQNSVKSNKIVLNHK